MFTYYMYLTIMSIPFIDQRNLGMSMRIERSSLDQVKKRFEMNKKKKEEKKKEYDFEERMKELREEVSFIYSHCLFMCRCFLLLLLVMHWNIDGMLVFIPGFFYCSQKLLGRETEGIQKGEKERSQKEGNWWSWAQHKYWSWHGSCDGIFWIWNHKEMSEIAKSMSRILGFQINC